MHTIIEVGGSESFIYATVDGEGQPKSTVVLCAPWGYEHNCSYQSLRVLAATLAAQGHRVVRFDPLNSGNSAGDEAESGGLPTWRLSLRTVFDWARATGANGLVAVGIRLGNCALVSELDALDSAVLWDPPKSGSQISRGLRAKAVMWGHSQAPGAAEGSVVAGHMFPKVALETFAGFDLVPALDSSAVSTLVLTDDAKLVEQLQGLGGGSGRRGLLVESPSGTQAMLDVIAEESRVPEEILGRICSFVGLAHHPTFSMTEKALTTNVAVCGAHAPAYVERHQVAVEVPLHLVVTSPLIRRKFGTVLFVNNGVARSIGPGRAWVEISRRLAAHGIQSCRLDVSGLGESATRVGQSPNVHYPIEGIDDIRIACRAISGATVEPVIVVGVCSGAFLALDAAAYDESVVGAVSVNPAIYFVPDKKPQRRPRRANRPTNRVVRRVLYSRVGFKFEPMIPSIFWRCLDAVRLHPLPFRGVCRAGEAADISLILWDQDESVRQLDHHSPTWRKQIAATQSVRTDLVAGVDHSMFDARLRNVAEARIFELAQTVFEDC